MLKTFFLNNSILILFILHFVGILGLLSPYQQLFKTLTPFNLILSAYFLFSKQTDFSKSFWLFAIIIFIAGHGVEVLGVQTKLIFGSYQYGTTMGPKLLNVPILMGLNWLNLIYGVGVVLNRLQIPTYFKSVLGAGIMVILDVFLEPVAMKYDFWSWENNLVPAQNYIAWFICSYLFLNFFYFLNFKKQNPFALYFIIIQFIFFIFLSVFI